MNLVQKVEQFLNEQRQKEDEVTRKDKEVSDRIDLIHPVIMEVINSLFHKDLIANAKELFELPRNADVYPIKIDKYSFEIKREDIIKKIKLNPEHEVKHIVENEIFKGLEFHDLPF